MLRTIFLLLEVLFILGLAAAVFLGRLVWQLDLLSFFWTLFIVAAVLVLLLSLAFKGPLAKVLAIVAIVVACIPIARLPSAPQSGEVRNLRLVSANLYIANYYPKEFLAFLAREQPDIVVTLETSKLFQDAIHNSGLYPFETSSDLHARDDKKIFSRYPIREERQIVDKAAEVVPLERHPLRTVIDTPNGPIVLYAVHPESPRRPWRWQQRNMYLDTLANAIERESKSLPVIAAGDWNTPPWSAYFRDFFKRTGYRSIQSHPWPETTRFITRLQRLFTVGAAIDHVAMSPQVSLVDWQVGPKFGSDHLPLVVDLALPQASNLALAKAK